MKAATTSSPSAFAERKRAANEAARTELLRDRCRTQAPEHDRSDGEGDHGEVDLDVREVVDEPLPDLEGVVAAPELPVGAERLGRGGAAEQPACEEDAGEDERHGARPAARSRSRRVRGRRSGTRSQSTPRASEPGQVERRRAAPGQEGSGHRAQHGASCRSTVGRSSARAVAYSAQAAVRYARLSVITVATEIEEGIATARRGRAHRPPGRDEAPGEQVDGHRGQREEEGVRRLEQGVGRVDARGRARGSPRGRRRTAARSRTRRRGGCSPSPSTSDDAAIR